ncbi:glycoside hydrolase family 88 protein [Kaistella sp. G5-32]|uniref:Glycoside hydrolase family 88 protein n=1 Tax=Kaistella gelatinilytica TaxID=2787636 RepID=A0ABS0FC14_9FLAO|nr:glycoside hydrolase family 88 protein [Kaistella gelatinilytica]MBF8457256.1 glycoside hydrolase family 88 protein [Kaistella gelatinilytica]
MLYVLLFTVLAGIIILLIDVIPEFYKWQSRIHIGRFSNVNEWQEKVLHTSKKWLASLPTVKLTDQNRLVFIDVLRGNYKRASLQSWQEGALVLGLTAYVKNSNDQKVQRQVETYISKKMTSSGHWKIKPTETDQSLLAYAMLQIDSINHHNFKPAFDETYQMIISLKGEDGTIAYKNHVSEFRFVDTVGFICPFLVNYGVLFDIPEAVNLAVKQIKEYQKWGMMPIQNIPCHTYKIDSKIPVGLFGWGRGLGWFVIGLIDSWHAIPDNHPLKAEIKEIIIKTAHSVFPFQNEDGSFPWLLFDPGSRADSSATATSAWFFTLAAEIPEIKIECVLAKEKCMRYLQSVTRRDGTVDFSQGDTKGIGVYSMNFDRLPFTQGFVLRTLNKLP